MSAPKPSAEKNTNDSEQPSVPSRTMGLSLMCLMIAFVALWMTLQSANINGEGSLSESVSAADLAAQNWLLTDDTTLGFVRIPAGAFLMGSNPAIDRLAYENERWSASRRQGTVELDDYYISKHEVTVAQFRLFTRQNPELANPVPEDVDGNLPITNITWPEALAYARWLEEQLRASSTTPEELRRFLESGGKMTLPSEAEWEKAARGSDGRVFPWGNNPTADFANFSGSAVLAVGSKPCAQCAYGLQDMSGNVWELTRSPLQDYPYDPSDDADTVSADALWVMRGGSFADAIANVRAAVRGGVDPGVRNNTIGFRLVLSKS